MGISYTFKMQAEHIKNMYGCVVDHKLLYLYMYILMLVCLQQKLVCM